MSATNGTGGEGARPEPRLRWGVLAAAVVVWLWTTLSHGFGTEIAAALFSWAEEPGVLADAGGRAGVGVLERLLAVAFLSLFAVAVGRVVWGLRGLGRRQAWARLAPWLIWAAFLVIVWRCLIIYATEFIHFAQYGVIAALLCRAIERGRRPQLAFLVAAMLGMLDEAWQHWGIAYWIEGYLRHGLDWSDFILNATGAAGGVLAVATLRASDETRQDRAFVVGMVGLAALFLPLLLLDRVALAELFGWYHYHPFWHEHEHGKPVHWMTPVDGIPLFLAAFVFLGALVGPRRGGPAPGAMLAILLLIAASIELPSRRAPRPVHEPVPTVRAARVPKGSVHIDGVLAEDAWAHAERVGPFVHHVTGGETSTLDDGTRLSFAPTHARVLWDDDALYVAFEATDGDVWARDVPRDEGTLPGDEVVEVFLDPDGDEISYYELEFSPRNVQYDLFNVIPQPPTDHNPWAPFLGLADWDARGLRSAVSVRGTLDVVDDWEPGAEIDQDEGWTVEIAIPWSTFRTTTTPSGRSWVTLPPQPGHRWRLGLYRVERPRVSPVDGAPLDRRAGGRYQQLQAWSHTLVDSFHVPARFGIVEFVEGR